MHRHPAANRHHAPLTTRARVALVLACHLPLAAIACDRCVPHPSPHDTARGDTATLLRDLDQRAAAAASARPSFSLPARIGIARMEHGVITPIPPEEWTIWQALRQQMSPTIGELSPVTAIVAQSLTTGGLSRTPHDAITNLRLAAAREQLDIILLYDVSTVHTLERTEASFLDITIVGAWAFPTHKSHATAHASATLIDVRSGLSCGSAIGNAADVCSAALLGSEEKLHRQRALVMRRAVTSLSTEVGGLMNRLAQSPTPQRSRYDDVAGRTSASRDSVIDTRPAPTAVQADTADESPAESGDSFWGRR